MSLLRARSGGHLDFDDRQPVVEVLAEHAARRARAHRLVRRADHARAARERVAAADALESAVLQHAEELRLQRRVEVADLVEEERAAVGLLEATLAPRRRAR